MKVKLTYMRIIIAAFAIGLLANAFGPSLSNASVDKKIGQLIDNLIKVRTTLSLYRAYHNGQLPPSESFENFRSAVVTQDKSCQWRLKKIPENPFNHLNTVRFDGAPAGANLAGYRLDTLTGDFQADNNPAYSAL